MGNPRARSRLLLTPPPESPSEKLDVVSKTKTRNATTTVEANSKRKRSASRQSQSYLGSPPARRRKKNQKPKQKVKDLKPRRVSACQECRRRKIRCTHHLSVTNEKVIGEAKSAQDADVEMVIESYDGAAEFYQGPPSPRLPLLPKLPILDALQIPFDVDFGFLTISDNKASKVKSIPSKPPQQSRIRSATFPSCFKTQRWQEVDFDFDDDVPPILYHDIIGVSGNNIFGTLVAPQLSDAPELPERTRFSKVDLNGKVFGISFLAAPGELSPHGSDEIFDINMSDYRSFGVYNDPRTITQTETSSALMPSTPDLEKRPSDEPKLSPRKKRLCQRSKMDYEKASLLR